MRAILIALVLLLATPAVAHQRTTVDNDDSPGPLDLVAAHVRHRPDNLKLHVRTYEAWDDDALEGEKNFIRFEFNLDADRTIERCLVVKLNPSEGEGPTVIEGGIFGNNCSEKIADHPGNVFRNQPNGLTLTRKPPKFMKEPFRWRSLTSFEEEGHPDCPTHTKGPELILGSCTDYTRWDRHSPA